MEPDELSPTDALFLDFDGTLVEIAEHPESVNLPRHLPALLAGVRDTLGGALAIVSGRRLEDIDRWLAPFRFAGAGIHGAHIRRDPDGPTVPEAGAADVALPVQQARAAIAGLAGAWLEDKGGSLAMHYRSSPESGDACIAAADALAREFGLVAVRGKMVVEIRPAGIDKGTAVRRLVRETPFRSRRPIFLGDDVTDEDGFLAVQELGGTAIIVGDRRPTLATRKLDSVTAVLDLLGRI